MSQRELQRKGESRRMTPATFCKCGAGVCGHICCKTEQDPKTCDGIWHPHGGTTLWKRVIKKVKY